ncbi:MAG: hypothetical protein SFV81_21165 [Pirellulaceae bacterium]|nr:hypothetical protein [Pirellulaceae bacterium]
MVTTLGQNGGHNPFAEVDVDVSRRAIGDLGSWLGYLAIRACSMIVPEMIAPFYVVCAANSQSDLANVWSPYHTFRPHLAESTFAPVNCVSLSSNRKRDLDWGQALIVDENAVPE